MTMQEKIARYKADFDLFFSPDEKIEYIIDLGKHQIPLKENEKNDESFIKGCSSNAWLICECDHDKMHFRGEGESMMAKGMMHIILDIFNHRTAEEILSFDPAQLQSMGIAELLSPVRQQGLEAFLSTIYDHAKRCKSAQTKED